jgi:hypothetical protein
MPFPIARVEAQVGRAVKDWLAADVARVIAELQAVKDGMATIDETWPAPGADEPRRENVTDVVEQPRENESEPSQPAAASNDAPKRDAPSSSPPAVNDDDWRIPDNLVGQDNVIASLVLRLQEARWLVHVDAIERVNAERIAKITGVKRQQLDALIRQTREKLTT